MATSSLLERIRVNNPKAVEEFVTAMELSAKKGTPPRTDDQRSGVVTDSKRIRSFMAKALQNKSGKK
jgi:hypothetical protein